MPPPVPETGAAARRLVSTRWTPDLVAGGWTPVADYFLDSYAKLTPPMSTSEAMLVIHLMRHKWDDAPPFPGFNTLSKRMGVTATSVRNHARSLEQKGYLIRRKRVGTTNHFDLVPLFVALEKLQAYEAGLRDAGGTKPRRQAAPAEEVF
jgi:hypothetical protein